jgi:hypothetical protein
MQINMEEIINQMNVVRDALNSDQSPFEKNYWKAPAPAAQGSASQDDVFLAVGAALSAWESAESALATLYVIMCDGETGTAKALARTFGAITSSASRREAIREAAEIYFGQHWSMPTVKKRLSRMLDAIGEASRRRDEIAHGQAYGYSVNNISHGFFLFASAYISSRNNAYPQGDPSDPFFLSTAKYRYSAAEIREFERRFNALRDAIFQYLISIRKIHGTPGEIFVTMQPASRP